jgi:methyl-accepting chemotaxis protein
MSAAAEALAAGPLDFEGSPSGLVADARMILPLARAVVLAVSPKTEAAALSLLDRFNDVQAVSDRAAESSKGLLDHVEGRCSDESLTLVAERSRGAIQTERDAVARFVEGNSRNIAKLRKMTAEIEVGKSLIKEIEEITDRAQLIAFNMAVEAAHIGDKGRGFKVIVQEMRRLNENTVVFSGRILDLLTRYKDYGVVLVKEMEEHTALLENEVVEGLSVSIEALEALISSSQASENLSCRLAEASMEVHRNLDKVIEALQFQDVTRQMLEGALGMLDDLAGLARKAEPASRGAAFRDPAALAKRFEKFKALYSSKAKTKDEKVAIMGVKL